MPRNGSGQFSLVNNSWNPATVGNLATSGDWQSLINDIATALTQSVSRDGQTPITGNLQMGNNKITGLTAGSGTGQAVSFEQLFNQGTEQDLASAATTDIGAQLTNFLRITGTTTITSFGTNYRGPRYLRFAGAVTLTNSSTLICPGNADITTSAGDCVAVTPKATSGVADGWQIVGYQKNQTPGTPSSGSVTNASLADGAVYGTKMTDKIKSIAASVASNALTLTVNPTTLDFRSSTLTNGVPNTRTLASAASVVVPNTATLGTVSGQASRLAVLAIDNAGTVEAAVVNLAGGVNLSETTLISTTAISAAATSASTIYSTTARSNVPFRIVGFIDITEATAGTWATAPTLVQGVGGQALAALSSLGYGQTWQTVTRVSGTTYYNTTGKPICIAWSANSSSVCTLTVNGVILIENVDSSTNVAISGSAVIPPGASYVLTSSGGFRRTVTELR